MSVEARDGTRLRVRPIEPWDKDLLRRTLERMSDDSRYRRFFAPVGTVREADLAYLTEVDHHDHEALVALEPEEVAATVAFLAGPGGRPFSGAPVTMDLGWTAR